MKKGIFEGELHILKFYDFDGGQNIIKSKKKSEIDIEKIKEIKKAFKNFGKAQKELKKIYEDTYK